jgi:hypothetical protein
MTPKPINMHTNHTTVSHDQVPHNNTLRLHLLLDAWSKLHDDHTISDSAKIHQYSIVVSNINRSINERWVCDGRM